MRVSTNPCAEPSVSTDVVSRLTSNRRFEMSESERGNFGWTFEPSAIELFDRGASPQ
jgi:hypothetical protein